VQVSCCAVLDRLWGQSPGFQGPFLALVDSFQFGCRTAQQKHRGQ
jgi:hypothetical protein